MADAPPSKQKFLELFEKVTPPEFSRPLLDDPSYAIVRALAEIFSRLATKAARTQQGAFYSPHAKQIFPPASSAIKASGTTTIRLDGNSSREILALPGELRLEGRGSRFYANSTTIRWLPESGPQQSNTATFTCEVPGFVGNLDFLADDNGNLPLDRISIADQSNARANEGGTIGSFGEAYYLQDSGVPDLFRPEDVGLYVQINQAANAVNEGRVLKITGFDFPAEEIPVGAGLYPRRVYVATNEYSVPREVLVEDNSGSSFSDVTSAAISTSTVSVFPGTPAADDALYVLSNYPMKGLRFTVIDAAEMDATFTWEYWDGTSWAAFSGVQGEGSDLTIPGTVEVSWDMPASFTASASPSSGTVWYQVRLRISSFTSTTTAPTFQTLSSLDYRPLTDETSSVTWSLLDFKDLGLVITETAAFAGGRDDDLRLLGEDRNLYQQDGETDDQFRERVSRLLDTVSPNAILRAINRQLRGYGAQGLAIDVSNGLTGLFADQDFFDYYTAGEVGVAHATAGAVSTTNINLAATGYPTIDGYSLNTSDELGLLVGQTNPIENGLWRFGAGVPVREPWAFTGNRALYSITGVTSGTTYAGTTWIVNAGDIVGTDALTIQQLSVDTFPTDLNLLNLSLYEAHGFFLVQLPFLDAGEFGMAYDEGPSIYSSAASSYFGSALDSGFFDGSVVTADALYGAIYSSIDTIRAGGVGFSMVRSTVANNLTSC